MIEFQPSEFRRISGQTMAALVRRFGPQYLEDCEDATQAAFVKALKLWPVHGMPAHPGLWVKTVATNLLLDVLKKKSKESPFNEEMETPSILEESISDELKLIAICCHPSIPASSQVPLALRVVFGFGPQEISRALGIPVPTVQQRIVRAKTILRTKQIHEALINDSDVVYRLLYLVFSEGYLATSGTDLTKPEICAEAIRYTMTLRRERPSPTCEALLSLMLFHASRLPARLNEDQELCLLRDQDRSKWDKTLISLASNHLANSAEGQTLTRYHIEAAIASVHAQAKTYADTDWPTLLSHYDALASLDPSPITLLNRAIILAEVHGPKIGLAQLDHISSTSSIKANLYYCVARADFLEALNKKTESIQFLQQAHKLTKNSSEMKFIERKIRSITSNKKANQ